MECDVCFQPCAKFTLKNHHISCIRPLPELWDMVLLRIFQSPACRGNDEGSLASYPDYTVKRCMCVCVCVRVWVIVWTLLRWLLQTSYLLFLLVNLKCWKHQQYSKTCMLLNTHTYVHHCIHTPASCPCLERSETLLAAIKSKRRWE